MGWRINPASFSAPTGRAQAVPPAALIITENGAPYDDAVSADGEIHDPARIAYLRDHIAAVLDAIDAGVDVRGYFVWSLLDNFEWAWGHSKRFGIVYVDFDTGARTPKDSTRWFRAMVRNRVLT